MQERVSQKRQTWSFCSPSSVVSALSLQTGRRVGQVIQTKGTKSFELKLQCWFPDMNILEPNFALMLWIAKSDNFMFRGYSINIHHCTITPTWMKPALANCVQQPRFVTPLPDTCTTSFSSLAGDLISLPVFTIKVIELYFFNH